MRTILVRSITNVTPLPDELAGLTVEVLRGPEGPICPNGEPHPWYYVCAQRNADGTHTPCNPTCLGPHHEGIMRTDSDFAVTP
jgi:hypothetical protein